MLTQEEYMDLLELRRQGLTVAEIAQQLGYHRTTIGKWLKAGGPPSKRATGPERVVLGEGWKARIDQMLAAQPALLATSIYDLIVAEGFTGSYPTVVRYVRSRRGPRFRSAAQVSLPIETAPGQEAQFDWTDCSGQAGAWGWPGPLWCFGAILCWSRWRLWWFTVCADREHTFEGLVRFFEAVGGVPRIGRTDRMGALGRSQGKRFVLHPPAREFARHHGIVIAPCQAGDAKRKGKVERPFRQLKEGFLPELGVSGPPADLADLNARAQAWLERRVHAVAHRITGVPPTQRLETERQLLAPLPSTRFDTAYVEPRRVHTAIPLITYGGVRYSVPVRCLGQTVEVRREVTDQRLVVRWAGVVVATHHLRPSGADDVWDPTHHAEAVHAALTGATGRHLHPVPPTPNTPDDRPDDRDAVRLELAGDYEVETPDLAVYGHGCECAGWSS